VGFRSGGHWLDNPLVVKRVRNRLRESRRRRLLPDLIDAFEYFDLLDVFARQRDFNGIVRFSFYQSAGCKLKVASPGARGEVLRDGMLTSASNMKTGGGHSGLPGE